jgi:hypothetical protein
VKSASIYATSIVDLHAKPGGATFGEFFKKSETALTEIDKAMISARSGTSQSNPYLDRSLAYMSELQELVRTSNRVVLTAFDGSNAQDRGARAMAMSEDSSYAIKFKLEALEESKKAMQKAAHENGDALAKAAEQVKKLRTHLPWVSRTFGDDGAVPESSLGAFEAQLNEKLRK